jgi:hypothetical protein
MPFQAKPWYRSQTDSWYVEIDGRQQNLGKHPENSPPPRKGKHGWNAPPAILTAFHKLMAEGPQLPPAAAVLVCQVCDLFLTFSEKHNDARTFKWYKAYLQDFCDSYGTMKAVELKPLHVTRWLDAHPDWGTGRRCAITAVKRAFNWCVEQGVLTTSPIKAVKKPATPSRARTMTREERAELLAAIPDEHFRLFVEAMQETSFPRWDAGRFLPPAPTRGARRGVNPHGPSLTNAPHHVATSFGTNVSTFFAPPAVIHTSPAGSSSTSRQTA